MLRERAFTLVVFVLLSLSLCAPCMAGSIDLLQRSCSELIRMAESFQDDEKIVNTVLGSAIDSGSMQNVKKYKLKKAAVKKNLNQIMKAIEIKGCVAR